MKALVLTPSKPVVEVRELPVPTPGPNEVLIQVHAVALNPVDEFFSIKPIAKQESRIIGTDFAGVVVGAGEGLANSSDSRVKKGARVAGFHQGACSENDRPGAFAEYITAPYDLLWLVPSEMSLEEASTISMCGLTAAQSLFDRLGLPSPFLAASETQKPSNSKEPIYVLVYGASTSLGLYVAQLVRASASFSGQDLRLIGTASASKHGLLSESPYKYEKLVDYRDPNWEQLVLDATNGKGVDYALDCISEGETVPRVHSTLKPDAKFAVFRGADGGQYETESLRIQPLYGAVWECLGEAIEYNEFTFPANPEARQFAVRFFEYLSSAPNPSEPRLAPNPVRQMPGGLERIVPDGFSLLGGGWIAKRSALERTEDYMRPISAEKLVYTIV